MPDDKAEKCARMLKPLLRSEVKMLRKDLERLLGLLWFTYGTVWLRLSCKASTRCSISR